MNRKVLLDTALKHVKRHGWTKDSLAAGAIELGLPPAAHGLVPNGAGTLVSEFQKLGNEKMKKDLEEYLKDPQIRSKSEITEYALWSRLQHTSPIPSTFCINFAPS